METLSPMDVEITKTCARLLRDAAPQLYSTERLLAMKAALSYRHALTREPTRVPLPDDVFWLLLPPLLVFTFTTNASSSSSSSSATASFSAGADFFGGGNDNARRRRAFVAGGHAVVNGGGGGGAGTNDREDHPSTIVAPPGAHHRHKNHPAPGGGGGGGGGEHELTKALIEALEAALDSGMGFLFREDSTHNTHNTHNNNSSGGAAAGGGGGVAAAAAAAADTSTSTSNNTSNNNNSQLPGNHGQRFHAPRSFLRAAHRALSEADPPLYSHLRTVCARVGVRGDSAPANAAAAAGGDAHGDGDGDDDDDDGGDALVDVGTFDRILASLMRSALAGALVREAPETALLVWDQVCSVVVVEMREERGERREERGQ